MLEWPLRHDPQGQPGHLPYLMIRGWTLGRLTWAIGTADDERFQDNK